MDGANHSIVDCCKTFPRGSRRNIRPIAAISPLSPSFLPDVASNSPADIHIFGVFLVCRFLCTPNNPERMASSQLLECFKQMRWEVAKEIISTDISRCLGLTSFRWIVY